MDGDIDYSQYSRAQLEEALSRIDKARYPKNLEKLRVALDLVPIEDPAQPRARDYSKWTLALGWYLVAATLVVLGQFMLTIVNRPAPFGMGHTSTATVLSLILIAVFTLVLITVTAAGGFLLIRRHRFGPKIAIASFALQLLTVTIPALSYEYVALVALRLYWSNDSFGFIALTGPDIHFKFGGSNLPYIGLDVLSAVAILVLVKSIRVPARLTNGWSGRAE
jgi:hypothetical protein